MENLTPIHPFLMSTISDVLRSKGEADAGVRQGWQAGGFAERG